jgi:hypothetical protein
LAFKASPKRWMNVTAPDSVEHSPSRRFALRLRSPQSPYEDVQDIGREPRIVSQAVAQCERERQHTLPDLHGRKDTIDQMSRRVRHAPPAAVQERAELLFNESGNRAVALLPPGEERLQFVGDHPVERGRFGIPGAVWNTDRHTGVWSSTPARKSRLSPTVASSVPCDRSA